IINIMNMYLNTFDVIKIFNLLKEKSEIQHKIIFIADNKNICYSIDKLYELYNFMLSNKYGHIGVGINILPNLSVALEYNVWENKPKYHIGLITHEEELIKYSDKMNAMQRS
ncbi:MAG: hypothetical protein ACRCV0_02275, partial [Brevinema sp.]